MSTRNEFTSVYFCQALCPSRDKTQLTNSLVALGWGILLITAKQHEPPPMMSPSFNGCGIRSTGKPCFCFHHRLAAADVEKNFSLCQPIRPLLQVAGQQNETSRLTMRTHP